MDTGKNKQTSDNTLEVEDMLAEFLVDEINKELKQEFPYCFGTDDCSTMFLVNCKVADECSKLAEEAYNDYINKREE